MYKRQDKDYEPVYEIPSDKRKGVEELSSLAKKTKTVWLASDEDREGEAIAWHLAEVIPNALFNDRPSVIHSPTFSSKNLRAEYSAKLLDSISE